MSKYERKNFPPSPWEEVLKRREEVLKQPAPWDEVLARPLPGEPKPPSKPTVAELVKKGRLVLGHHFPGSEIVMIQPEQLSTHMHVLGASGVGKSFFLESLIKALIQRGHGLCLIDPHGDLYQRVLDCCTQMHFKYPRFNIAQRVIPFNIAESRRFFGFNPMARSTRSMSYQADALAEAIFKAWGQDSPHQTPRLARWLPNAAHAIIETGLTLVQSKYLLDPLPNPQREAIIQRLKNPDIKREWEYIESRSVKERDEKLESTYNRLRDFVKHDVIRFILGQRNRVLDFTSLLNERKILLVNLAGQNVITNVNQETLGALLVNELLAAAFARPRDQRCPFFLFIDEFSQFVTKDICKILDGGRKFGLHLILAHQYLSQLQKQDSLVYNSTLTNARLKCVFGGLGEADLDLIGREMFTGELDPYLVKQELERTVWEPVESTRVVEAYNESRSQGEGKGHFTHESLNSGMFIPGSDPLAPPMPTSTSEAHGSGSGDSTTFSESHTSGHSRSVVPFIEHHKAKELASREFMSLDEQLYLMKAKLKNQPNQHYAFLMPGQNVQFLKAGTLEDLGKQITERQRQKFLDEAFTHAGCFSTPEEIEREQQEIEQSLLTEAPLIIETESIEETQRPTKKEAPAGKGKPRRKPQPPKSTIFDNVQFDQINPPDKTEGE